MIKLHSGIAKRLNQCLFTGIAWTLGMTFCGIIITILVNRIEAWYALAFLSLLLFSIGFITGLFNKIPNEVITQ
jgi:hypothetical protein